MQSMLRRMSTLAGPTILGIVVSYAQDVPTSSQAVSSPAANQRSEHTPAMDAERPHAPGDPRVASQVRIVRLSQAKGQVQLDRNTDLKFEPAFVNIPIIAGERLRTLDGLAEVEFEDNSSLRLTPNSLVEFPVLGRDASGATSTNVKLVKGSLYLSLADSKATDGFTLTVGKETITLTPSSHLRIDLAASSAKLALFKGSVTLADTTHTLIVTGKKNVSFDIASDAAPVFAHNEGAAVFDKWDKNAVDYHKMRSSAATFAGSPYAYGGNDLSYYGSFTSFSGCGSLWRPYLTTANWNPYGSGVWSWYPGSGYSWVSPYPWGWTPFHSGSWEFCPGIGGGSGGWGWRPLGGWNSLMNHPPVRPIKGPLGPLPPTAPRPGQATLVAVNLRPMPTSRVDAGNTFVFRSDSAGMGVPRGVFSNLGKISQSVAQHGIATTSVSDVQEQRGFIATGRVPSSISSSGIEARGSVSHPSSSMGLSSGASHSSSVSSSVSSGASGPSAAASGGSHH